MQPKINSQEVKGQAIVVIGERQWNNKFRLYLDRIFEHSKKHLEHTEISFHLIYNSNNAKPCIRVTVWIKIRYKV